jgi:hypothetical protein
MAVRISLKHGIYHLIDFLIILQNFPIYINKSAGNFEFWAVEWEQFINGKKNFVSNELEAVLYVERILSKIIQRVSKQAKIHQNRLHWRSGGTSWGAFS